MDRREEILKIFPRDLRQIFSRIPVGFDYMEEIRLRAGQPVFMVYGGREYAVGASGELLDPGMIRAGQEAKVSLYRVSGEQLAQIVEYMSSYSMYAAQEEIRQGFFYHTGRTPHRYSRQGSGQPAGSGAVKIYFFFKCEDFSSD